MGHGVSFAYPVGSAAIVNPRVSIVVEWDNVLLAGSIRANAMLRTLAAEIQGCDLPCETLLCHNPVAVPNLELDVHGLPGIWRPVPVPGSRYYDLKNRGALEASGDIIVFLDSDVIPEPGWLKTLLEPFADPSVQVVAGHSYIDPGEVYSKAFALTWFFPLRTETRSIQPVSHFFANNVAFRRGTFLAHPFPTMDSTSRGACVQLAKDLAASGIIIWKTSAAQVAHPAPQPGRHFVLRALAQGRDRLHREQGWRASFLGSFARYCHNCGRGLVSTFRGRRQVHLAWTGVPAVLAICFSYYSLCFAGEVMTHLRLPAVRRIQI